MYSKPKTKQTRNKIFLPDSAEDMEMDEPLLKYLNNILNVSLAF